MKKFFLTLALIPSVCVVSACGTARRDLENSEKRERALKNEQLELQNENRRLKDDLNRIVIVNDRMWIFKNMFVDYNSAEKQCLDIGFLLPTDADIAELKALDAKEYDDFTVKINGEKLEFHIKDKTTSLNKGAALCTKKTAKKN